MMKDMQPDQTPVSILIPPLPCRFFLDISHFDIEIRHRPLWISSQSAVINRFWLVASKIRRYPPPGCIECASSWIVSNNHLSGSVRERSISNVRNRRRNNYHFLFDLSERDLRDGRDGRYHGA